MRTSLRGLAVSTLVRTVSSDGKTLTVVQKGTDPKGRKVSNTMVLGRSSVQSRPPAPMSQPHKEQRPATRCAAFLQALGERRGRGRVTVLPVPGVTYTA